MFKIFREFLRTADDFKGFDADGGVPLYEKNHMKRAMIFLFPFFLAFILIYFRVLLDHYIVNSLLSMFSILTLTLFNAFFFMHILIPENGPKSDSDPLDRYYHKVYREATKKITVELMFLILISIVNILFTFVFIFLNSFPVLGLFLSSLVYYFTALFFIVLLRTVRDISLFSEYLSRK
ncbi:MAG: hypothetical protein ACP5MB_10680 [bacterium]